MKTSFTKMAILVAILASTFTNVQAKMSDNALANNYLAIADFNIENEINSNLQQLLSNTETDSLQRQITKHLAEHALKLHSNELRKDAEGQLPAYKFNVQIAD